MSIYKYPLAVIKPLSAIGRRFPKFILDIRYFVHNKALIHWSDPENIQEYSLCQLFRSDTDLDRMARLADKVDVRDFIKEKIGENYLTELYGVYESADQIDFNLLPDRFVLKTNNGCGNNFIVKNKKALDISYVKKQLNYWLKFPYGNLTGQIHYSKIRPLILAEQFLEQSATEDILPFDYKFMCYKGEPRYVLYYEGRSLNGHTTPNMLFDMDWKAIPHAVKRPTDRNIKKPVSFDEMKQCVAGLCADFDFVRVDFYEIKGRPIFGEMTFTPDIIYNIREDFTGLMKIHKGAGH